VDPSPLGGRWGQNAGWGRGALGGGLSDYLVDPASSHMLVSKIKPCMCKFAERSKLQSMRACLLQRSKLRSFSAPERESLLL
jgi:hypothetical protein